MLKLLKREPAVMRTLVLAIVAVVAALIPDLDVGAVEGVVFGVVALVAGVDIRRKVTPA